MTVPEPVAVSSEALRIFALIGDIEWFGIDVGYDDGGARRTPPQIAWRYEIELEGFLEWIRDTVEGYEGTVAWTVDKPDRNFLLLPKRVSEELVVRAGDSGKDVARDIGSADPEFANDAISDLRPLLAYLRAAIAHQGV